MSNGTTVIDFKSGGFGYGHPDILEAVGRQLKELPLSNRSFLSEPLGRLVHMIGRLVPGRPQVVYPTNSGTEAIDAALKLAFGFHTDRRVVVSCLGAHHGSEIAPRQLTGSTSSRARSGFLTLESRCIPHGAINALNDALRDDVAAMVIEPIPTSAGFQSPPADYLRSVRTACDRVGALLVFDEIGTCMGRTGRDFAAQHANVDPDIVVLGGALGGGVLPIATCVSSIEINRRVYGRRHPALHGSTTGGNPIACTAAITALDIIERDGISARCRMFESIIENTLRSIARTYSDFVNGHRVIGLLGSLQIRDIDSAESIVRHAWDCGVLLSPPLSIPKDTDIWISIRPPLLISKTELKRGLSDLAQAVAAADIENGSTSPTPPGDPSMSMVAT